MDKRKDFIKSIAVIGTAVGIAIGSGKLADNVSKSDDLSKYTVKDDKYVDYIEGSEHEKFKAITELDNNISKYEKLNSKFGLSDEEKEELKEATKAIKDEMASGDLADFYLNDLLKEKLKSAYKANNVETRYWNREEITIKMFDKYGKPEIMEDKDKVQPIKIAMKDIATLQSYMESEQFSNSDIKEFIRIQKNMKGFSNLKFIKSEGKPLAYAQIDIEKDNDREF